MFWRRFMLERSKSTETNLINNLLNSSNKCSLIDEFFEYNRYNINIYKGSQNIN